MLHLCHWVCKQTSIFISDKLCRLLCVAYKDLDVDVPDDEVAMCKFTESPRTLFQPEEVDDFEHSLTAIFIAGISDPLRPEVRSAIESCKKGGISVRMFTGDNQVTAASIAADCGILTDDDFGPNAVLPSEEFIKRIKNSQDEVDRESFLENWRDIRVLARCSPSDKYTIVESLKRFTDEIVAVTGDGTNDAPALRIANVGFAMNDGTQIAKEAADIILVDNNFASTVSAALWGRNVYSNISKFLQFQLTVNLVALITAAGGAIASAESPLTTVQMLWVNLIMDSLASLALATGYPDISLLEQKPYKKGTQLVLLTLLSYICQESAGITLVTHMVQITTLWTSMDHSQNIFLAKLHFSSWSWLGCSDPDQMC